jgi:hypothetical protein
MFCLWWRRPGSCWYRHMEVFQTEEEAALRVPLLMRVGGGAAECVILPTGKTPE